MRDDCCTFMNQTPNIRYSFNCLLPGLLVEDSVVLLKTTFETRKKLEIVLPSPSSLPLSKSSPFLGKKTMCLCVRWTNQMQRSYTQPHNLNKQDSKDFASPFA